MHPPLCICILPPHGIVAAPTWHPWSPGHLLPNALPHTTCRMHSCVACSAYLTRLGTLKHRAYVAGDWTLTLLFGRDISRW